ncbi:MAG: Mov34/MPN/PAD-1 family protein [Acidobacteria bacterium]|nr:Mov34/MPN/PAD-1 family protein [Acidobacteriota bacterium]
MSGLLHVLRVHVPAEFAREAQEHLASVGRQGHEGFALWVGVLEGEIFHVRRTVIPAQRGLRFEQGVCVRVDGDELHRINVYLYQEGLRLMAQIHSHPTEAYHSETDDTYPIATTLGSLSLVVPDFARDPFSLARCAVYRLLPPAEWVELPGKEAEQLIILEG